MAATIIGRAGMAGNSRMAGINHDARRTAFLRGLMRLESLIIAGAALVMFALCVYKLFWFPNTWWLWLILGAAGPLALAWTAMRDTRAVRSMINTLLNEKCDARAIGTMELQAPVTRALHQHRTIQKLLAQRKENIDVVSASLDEWTTRVYHIASSLDTVLHDPTLQAHVRGTRQERPGATQRSLVEALTAAADEQTALETQPADAAQQRNLILARDTVTAALNGLSATIDSIVNITEVLRHARLLAMDRVHIAQLESLLKRELDVISDVERAVAGLAAAFQVALR